jgi:hypothetical protein
MDFGVKKRMKNKNNFLKTGRFVKHAKGQSIMGANEELERSAEYGIQEFGIQNS